MSMARACISSCWPSQGDARWPLGHDHHDSHDGLAMSCWHHDDDDDGAVAAARPRYRIRGAASCL